MATHRHRKQDLKAAALGLQTETPGRPFPDGTLVELVRKEETGELALLKWDGTRATLADHIEHEGRTFVPVTLEPTVLRAMRFPSRAMPYGSTRELFSDTCKLITRFNDLAEKFVLQVAHFIFGTWLVDRMPVAPFLSIVAPPTAPSAELLQLLALLCRRPLLLGELSPSGLCSLPMHLRPTLLIDAVGLSTPVQRLLRASNRQGLYVPRGSQALDLYCAKAVCSQESLCDPSLVGLALQIALAPTRQQLPILSGEASAQIADEFQAKLLQYRLTSFPKVCTPNIDVKGLTGPTQSLARSLAACVVGDEELQSGVVSLLREQDQEIQVERSAELKSVLLDALLFCCHDENRSAVRCGELADIANTIWAGRGENQQTTPESVGWKLRHFGLHREPISSAGNGLRLSNEIRARIHRLAWAYNVLSVRQGGKKGCRHCEELNKPGEEP